MLLSQRKSEAAQARRETRTTKAFVFKVWVPDIDRKEFSRRKGHQCLQRLEARDKERKDFVFPRA